MNVSVAIGLMAFYAAASIVMVQAFLVTDDRSVVFVGRWVLLYIASVVSPLSLTLSLMRKLRERGAIIDIDMEIMMFLPAWCAAITALIALIVVPG